MSFTIGGGGGSGSISLTQPQFGSNQGGVDNAKIDDMQNRMNDIEKRLKDGESGNDEGAKDDLDVLGKEVGKSIEEELNKGGDADKDKLNKLINISAQGADLSAMQSLPKPPQLPPVTPGGNLGP